MRIATLVLPTHDNRGESVADVHAALRADIAKSFGGFTTYTGSGAWRNDSGVLVFDPVAVYLIAMDDTATNRDTLESLARFHGRAASQDCVFIVHVCGTVRIVPCTYRAAHESRDAIDAITLA